MGLAGNGMDKIQAFSRRGSGKAGTGDRSLLRTQLNGQGRQDRFLLDAVIEAVSSDNPGLFNVQAIMGTDHPCLPVITFQRIPGQLVAGVIMDRIAADLQCGTHPAKTGTLGIHLQFLPAAQFRLIQVLPFLRKGPDRFQRDLLDTVNDNALIAGINGGNLPLLRAQGEGLFHNALFAGAAFGKIRE